MRDTSDEELMAGVSQGIPQAFTELVDRYKNRIVSYVYRHTNDYKTAEDLAQEVFLRVFRKAKDYIQTARFSTWLFTIAVNLVKDEYKRRTRHPAQSLDRQREDSLSLKESLEDESVPRPDWELSQKELGDNINRALNRLTVEDRTILILRDVQGLSYGEISDSVGVPTGTVKSRLNRARMHFKNIWKEIE